jgi:deazaflavin-dependent oxidoreductase (nitroreductase family)
MFSATISIMKIVDVILTLNKYVGNPLFMHIAGKTNTSFAVITHIGRKSGKLFKTPIIVRRVDEGFVAALTYGPTVNWYQNIVKAQHCIVLWHNKQYTSNKIESISTEKGLAAFPFPFNIVLKKRGTKDFILLKTEK